jgi:hypothetical protein
VCGHERFGLARIEVVFDLRLVLLKLSRCGLNNTDLSGLEDGKCVVQIRVA